MKSCRPPTQVTKLKGAHRHAKTQREADRITAVVLLSEGWTPAEVAEPLLLKGLLQPILREV